MTKQELEKRLLEASTNVWVHSDDLRWLTSPNFVRTLDCWGDLYAYYQSHDGDTTSISCEVVGVYLGFSRLCNELLRNPQYTSQYDEIEDALGSWEYFMDGLVTEGYRQLDNPRTP